MIAKIQLKLNNDVLLTVIKMVQQTDDYAVKNVTDALLISTKEDLITKLEEKAKNIHKQVSILDHNKKHSLVLKYHEAYSLYKLLDAVFNKQLFNDSPHIKRIKRLINELHNKVDIFAKEEDFAVVDVEHNDEVTTPAIATNLVETELFVNETTDQQVEITLEPAAFESLNFNEGVTDETHLNLFTEAPQENISPINSNSRSQTDVDTEEEQEAIIWEETLELDNLPIQEEIDKDLFSIEFTNENTIPKMDWEIIKAEDSIPSDCPPSPAAIEKQSLNDSKFSEFFNIAKKGINAEENDLAQKETKPSFQNKTTLFEIPATELPLVDNKPQEDITAIEQPLVIEDNLAIESEATLFEIPATELPLVDNKPQEDITAIEQPLVIEDNLAIENEATLFEIPVTELPLVDDKPQEDITTIEQPLVAEDNLAIESEATLFEIPATELPLVDDKPQEEITSEVGTQNTPNTKDVMQIEIFDVETIVTEPIVNKPKKERKKEKKNSSFDQEGQISLF
ncbi:hypothetical protein [Myroides phaeus]|uniref:hypothetical protein n=1 Tax=Myroides phaeus TaxID=702745 RepID=UPI0013031301|nr:hypothetical protein [Myroides phaeus]